MTTSSPQTGDGRMGTATDRLHSYPKVWNMGHPAIKDLFAGPVAVQEKVDGSQFTFGVLGGALHCRSKGATIDPDAPNGLFAPAVATAKRLHDAGLLTEGWQYRGEALCKPKHNTIAYDRAPAGGVILFDIDCGLENRLDPEVVSAHAERLGLECVPTFFHGEVKSMADLARLLETDSCLGGAKIEGVVVKNYARWGEDGKMLMGKYVSEAFKEKHAKDWRGRNPTRADLVEVISRTYATERRWEKAVEHLRDAGQLECSPRDIGKLMKAIPEDIQAECEQEIKDALFAHFWPTIRKGTTLGLPEWYKRQLAESQFTVESEAA
jgi:hypothetical protein